MPRSKAQAVPGTMTSNTAAVPATFSDGLPLPSIIVFDLDYTLWPFWVDTHVSSPLKAASPAGQYNTRMKDRWGETFGFYEEVPGILAAAKDRGVLMSLASRTHAPDLGREMLRGLHVPSTTTSPQASEGKAGPPFARAIDSFVHAQIYPGSKTTHFKRIQAAASKTGPSPVPFDDMLFFDDEGRNRNVETELGVTFWLVLDGVTRDEVDRGVWEWRRRRGITKNGFDAAPTPLSELEA